MNSNLKNIVRGPSKFDLMLALFDSKFPDFRTVVFQLEDGTHFEANITGVQAEDGSANSWNFTATGRLNTKSNEFAHVHGYYSTAKRTGTVTFPEGRVPKELARLDELVRQGNLKQFGDGRPVRGCAG